MFGSYSSSVSYILHFTIFLEFSDFFLIFLLFSLALNLSTWLSQFNLLFSVIPKNWVLFFRGYDFVSHHDFYWFFISLSFHSKCHDYCFVGREGQTSFCKPVLNNRRYNFQSMERKILAYIYNNVSHIFKLKC